jgi:hypothetical protein
MNRLRVQFAKNLIKQGCLQNLFKESGFDSAEDLAYYFEEFEGKSVEEYIITLKK